MNMMYKKLSDQVDCSYVLFSFLEVYGNGIIIKSEKCRGRKHAKHKNTWWLIDRNLQIIVLNNKRSINLRDATNRNMI